MFQFLPPPLRIRHPIIGLVWCLKTRLFSDFTSMEGDYMLSIFGRDDWLVYRPPNVVTLDYIGARAKESWSMEHLYQAYLSLIDPTLHCCLLNWMNQLGQDHSELERHFALGLQNIVVHVNPRYRALASQALACLKGPDRHIAGGSPPSKVI